MKTQLTNLFSHLNSRELKELTAEVKETLANPLSDTAVKTFCAADLWNIQRRQKTINPRRRYAF